MAVTDDDQRVEQKAALELDPSIAKVLMAEKSFAGHSPVPRGPLESPDVIDGKTKGVVLSLIFVVFVFFIALVYVGGGITGAVVLARSAVSVAPIATGPLFIEAIPDAHGAGVARVDFARAFSGDGLEYGVLHVEGNSETMGDGTLIVSGPLGAYTYELYASDGTSTVVSNLFSVILS